MGWAALGIAILSSDFFMGRVSSTQNFNWLPGQEGLGILRAFWIAFSPAQLAHGPAPLLIEQ